MSKLILNLPQVKPEEIKKNVTQTAERVTIHEEFPNGLILDIIQEADNVKVTANKDFYKNADGSISFVD